MSLFHEFADHAEQGVLIVEDVFIALEYAVLDVVVEKVELDTRAEERDRHHDRLGPASLQRVADTQVVETRQEGG
jgi:hypothetical protein